MRLTSAYPLLGLLLPLSAQAYNSEGWSPGKPVTKYLTPSSTAGAVPTGYAPPSADAEEESVPKEPWSLRSLKDFSLETVITSKGVSQFLGRFGFNVTAQLEAAREGTAPRFTTAIPLITDENYERVLMGVGAEGAELEDVEDEEVVWAILCSIGAQDPVSTYFDKTYDAAYNLTLEAGDAKHVRWRRIDYLDVTEITTRWGIWKAPVLIIARDHARELRFYPRSQLKNLREPEDMRTFIVDGEWEDIKPWGGPWSPRGSRAPFLAKFARYSAWIYGYLNLMPRWLLLLATGSIASTAVSFMHAGEEAKIKAEKEQKLLAGAQERRKREAREKREKEANAAAAAIEAESSAVKKAGTPKKRKGGKK